MDYQQLVNEARNSRPVKSHSGSVQPGDIFVALPGTRVNGNIYIPEVLEKGAAWVVSDHAGKERFQDHRIIGHQSPAIALGELARAYYRTESLDLVIVGITGTNGKTTISYLLEHIFLSSGFRTGVMGTVNCRWQGRILETGTTTPDCLKVHELLARMDTDGVEMVIMEVSSHALEQDRAAGVDFDAGVFTNLSQDHLDYHQDMERYFQAKAKLFLGTDSKKPFRSVVNADDEYGKRLLSMVSRPLGFGLDESGPAELAGRLLKNDRKGLSMECVFKKLKWTINSPLAGRHNASNLLAAQGAALAVGLGPEHFEFLESFGHVPGRLERVYNRHDLDIFVDYAHTPDALENVCQAVKALDYDRLIVLFGCGGNRDRSKRPLMGMAAARVADVIFVTSDNPRDEDPMDIIQDIMPGLKGREMVFVEPDRSKAIRMAVNYMNPGDALIVAGKGHETYQEIMGARNPFSDVQAIKKALEV